MSSSDEFAIPHTILRHFDLASSPYTESLNATIKSRRSSYPDGKLFLDQLLAFAEIDGSTLYPPTTPAGLRRLLHAIHESPLDRLKQDSFYYYLLLDYDIPSTSQTNGHARSPDMDLDGATVEQLDIKPKRAERFARRRCLPRTWRVFMDGYWALDHEDWDIAVACLSDPCITEINFIPQILSVLATRPSPPSCALSLLHTFLSFTLAPLSSPAEDDLKLLALASAGSLSEAFDFIRTFTDESVQTRMRESLWCWALGAPRGPCGSGPKGTNPRAIKQLLHLPLLPEEHAHLLQFLTHPPRSTPPQSLSALHDLVTLRLVHQGQYAESIQLDRESAGSAGSDSDRQRRREMVREFISILPETQHRALAIEGDERVVRKDRERAEMVNGYTSTSNTERTALTNDVDMSNSWIDVDHQPEVSASTPGIVAPQPQRLDSTLTVAKNTALPSSPAPPSPAPASASTPARHSPFTGPPRFASTQQQSPALLQRVLSGSPFALPRNVSMTGSPAPKGPRRIINDDDDPIDTVYSGPGGRQGRGAASRQGSVSVRSSAPPEKRESSALPPSANGGAKGHTGKQASVPAPRRSRRDGVASSSSQPPAATAREITPPASPPARKSRALSIPATPGLAMPGTFDPQPVLEENEPEDDDVDDVPPTPRTGTRGGGARSRITRSASRAILDEEPSTEQPKPKRTRRTVRETRETTVEETPARSTRRSTRTRGSTAQPSDKGSPTPSVAASVRSEAGRTRRRGVRESSVISTLSQTPRVTRSRK